MDKIKRLATPSLLLVIFILIHQYAYLFYEIPFFGQILSHEKVIPMLLWVAATFLLVRVIDVFFWQGYFSNVVGVKPPRIVSDLSIIFIWGISLAIASTEFLAQNIGGFLAASSVMFAIIGFALRSLIADLFYGVAITIERPFKVGDWIEIQNQNKAVIGRVKELNWRSTTIVTRENRHIVIPNNIVASSMFDNYSSPDPLWRSSFRITLGYEVPSHEVERLLYSAIAQVEESSRIPREPEVRIVDFSHWGVEWEVRFWCFDYPMTSQVEYKIRRQILRNLHYAGISIPRKRLEVYNGDLANEREIERELRSNWVSRLMLFKPLSEEDRETILSHAERHLVLKGRAVVNDGDSGDSLFVLYQGYLKATKAGHHVGDIRPGQIFGEYSLLTGMPRNATVIAQVDSIVYEVTKNQLEPILQASPQLADELAKVLADRTTQIERAIKASESGQDNEATGRFSLHARIRRFFNLT